MELYQDCREKIGHHTNIETFCKNNGITIIRKRLEVGDYMFPNGKISVDIKQHLEELANDLYRDRLAFGKKYKKCLAQGIKLIVLVEQPIKSFQELAKWQSKHSRISGQYLINLMHEITISYGVKFMFCDKSKTGEVLMQLLCPNFNAQRD